jgi:hypothetical protein
MRKQYEVMGEKHRQEKEELLQQIKMLEIKLA